MGIYLDSAATTPLKSEVIIAMMPYLTNEFGNPGTAYSLGRRARLAIEKAREEVAKTVGTTADHIIFTGSGSAANTIAVKSLVKYLTDNFTDKLFVSSKLEHDSVYQSTQKYCEEYGVDSVFLDTINGMPDSSQMLRLGRRVGAASLMLMNNETGNMTQIFQLKDTLTHRDCVQALGVIPIMCDESNIAFASFSAHKIGGPKGVGALYVRDFSIVDPVICGGSGQEFGVYGGTENVAGIVGFGEACKLIRGKEDENFLHCGAMANLFLESLRKNLKDPNVLHINSSKVLLPQRAKTVNIRLDGCDNESLILLADECGVCLSAGSACSDHVTIPSRVLKEIGLTDEQAMQSFRVSFSPDTLEQDAVEAGRIIAACYDILNCESSR